MEELIKEIRHSLVNLADEKLRNGSARFFKEAVKVHGVKSAQVVKLAKTSLARLPLKDKTVVLSYCAQLFDSEYLEESFIACQWAYTIRKQFAPEDFDLFEQWVGTYISNWAVCDTFCNQTMGYFLRTYPEFLERLIGWTNSSNRWVRRAAAVSMIVPARKGEFFKESLTIATYLLTDKDDLVQKGYGWLLKVASGPFRDEVFGFVMANKQQMPRTALRYAIEKMPPEMKKVAMAR